jgi:adenine-specific DNA-methyltransferase
MGKLNMRIADIACFDKITNEIAMENAQKELYDVVFCDSSFKNDSTRTNFEQIFNTYSPTTIKRVQ